MIPCDATSEYYDVEEAKVEGISSSARYCRPTIRCLQPHRAPDSSTLQRRGAPRAERGVRDRASSETCEYRQWVILRKEAAAKRACSHIALDERHKIVPFEWPPACKAARVPRDIRMHHEARLALSDPSPELEARSSCKKEPVPEAPVKTQRKDHSAGELMPSSGYPALQRAARPRRRR